MAKKLLSFLLTAALLLSLAACGQSTSSGNNEQNTSAAQTETDTGNVAEAETEASAETDTESSPDTATETTTGTSSEDSSESAAAGSSNILIAYFSWSGTTAEMASYIAEQTGGDLLEIEPSTPYSDDYDTVGEVAKEERDENARPGIANLPDNLDDYDTILIGYPIWWHTAPMIIGTFLENYDLSGKEVYPFTQSASMDTEQFDNSMDFVRNSAGNGSVHDGLFAESSATDEIDAYLSENNLTK